MRQVADFVFDEEWAVKMETGLRDYLDGLHMQDDPVTITGEPFDYCDECETREQIAFVVRETLLGARAGLVRLLEPGEE